MPSDPDKPSIGAEGGVVSDGALLTAGSGTDRGAVQGELVKGGEERKDSSFGESTREGGNTTHPIPPVSVESAVHVSQKKKASHVAV